MSAIEDRIEAAREAAWDEIGDAHTMRHHRDAIEAGVIAATRVEITEAVVDAFKRFGHPLPLAPNIMPALRAAFEAAGFEVIE